jgi:uncharacterized protein (DUF433 family)
MPATQYRYLANVPGVRSGRTIIEGTRIGVHDVIAVIVNGSSIDDVCRSYPGVTRAQVYECLSYYEDHRSEIDALIARQMSADLRGPSFLITTWQMKSPRCCVIGNTMLSYCEMFCRLLPQMPRFLPMPAARVCLW